MKTSFGEMEILLKKDHKPRIETLKFESAGRPHKHLEWEYFYVTSGEGFVYVGEQKIAVTPGSLVKIPPKTSHWMEPSAAVNPLEGLLWYDENELSLLS